MSDDLYDIDDDYFSDNEGLLKIKLSEVLIDVLMKYCFMFGETCLKKDLPLEDGEYLLGKVTFNGYRSGEVGIIASEDLCINLSANVIGVDVGGKDSCEDVYDSLKELTNIVCGQFLTLHFGQEQIFDLSPPTVSVLDKGELLAMLESDDTIGLIVDDLSMLAYVKVKL